MNLDIFLSHGFCLIEKYEFNSKYQSYIFNYTNYCIIIDDHFDIESTDNLKFDYSKYCEMQNNYMAKNEYLLRYNLFQDEKDLIETILQTLDLEKYEFVDENSSSYSESHIDNTPTEAIFEEVFVNAYGNEALECLHKEISISNEKGKNYFIDYVVETRSGNFAFEENGTYYHHPLIVGKDRYKELLDKQNTIVLLGYKIYRFSTNNLYYQDKTIQELKSFLPSRADFIPKVIIKNNRGLKLYKHQSDALKQLDQDRLNGKTTALKVIPTAAGKSEICITDLTKEYIKRNVKKILIMVPSTEVRKDWLKRIYCIKDYY